jgi:S-adenosylmethionine/arginine decarboxylase-like enzyme
MKHFMLDAYGVKRNNLNDIKYIQNTLNEITARLKLTPVAPPFLLPYYYGAEPEDIGISSFVFLKGGHLTIHTFPLLACYFVDLYDPEGFNETKAEALFFENWPFDRDKSNVVTVDRSIGREEVVPFDPSEIFGPHILARLTPKKPVTMEYIFKYLEQLVADVEMTPIIRPYVIFDSNKNPSYLSGITMIAESHISFHYNLTTGDIMFDIFSCKSFNYELIKKHLKKSMKDIPSFVVIPRGTRHQYLKENLQNKRALSERMKKYSQSWRRTSFK